MLGINGWEFMLLLLVGVVVVGPQRLPAYAEQLARWVRALRGFLGTARERVAQELGEEAADVDWASLDPRRYDPRRIVREALLEDLSAPVVPPVAGAGSAGGARRYTSKARTATGTTAGGAGAAVADAAGDAPGPPAAGAPFDDEAT